MRAPIPDWPWYEITDTGEVWSVWNSKRPRKFSTHTNGYRNVRLSRPPHVCKNFYIHRLVAQAFLPNPENLPEVDHIDGNPENNHVSNLRWVSHKQNLAHAVQRRGSHWCKGLERPETYSPYLAHNLIERIKFPSLRHACEHFGKKYQTFAPMVNKAAKNKTQSLGFYWTKL